MNMGCPKPFSIQGGMGAALLTQTDRVKEVRVDVSVNYVIICFLKI